MWYNQTPTPTKHEHIKIRLNNIFPFLILLLSHCLSLSISPLKQWLCHGKSKIPKIGSIIHLHSWTCLFTIYTYEFSDWQSSNGLSPKIKYTNIIYMYLQLFYRTHIPSIHTKYQKKKYFQLTTPFLWWLK